VCEWVFLCSGLLPSGLLHGAAGRQTEKIRQAYRFGAKMTMLYLLQISMKAQDKKMIVYFSKILCKATKIVLLSLKMYYFANCCMCNTCIYVRYMYIFINISISIHADLYQ